MKIFLRFIALTMVSLIVMSSKLNAQTVLIDPNGAGGFELGANMASNGWTVANAATDGWFVGNAPVVATGNNCGFISSTGGGGWAYSQLNVFNHMYRDITIPANESKVTLSFKWKAGGEGTGTSDWDNMKVFLAPTTTVPISTAAVTGATQLSGPGAVNGMYKLNSAAWNNETITFSGVPGTTYRLIFQWKSDGSDVVNPPAALDDISVVTSLPGIFISIITGNWNNPSTWDANAVPSPADNATVSTGHTVTVNATGQAINNLIVNGTLAYATTPTQFNVNGNLTVNVGGLVNVFNGTTGKTLFVSGNIVNDGTLNFSVGGAGNSATGASVLNLNGSTVQTINGTGSFTNNKIGSLTCSNTSTATPNINWQFDNIIIQHNLNLTGARFNLGNLTLSHGSSFNTTTGSMGLTAPAGTGFLPGAKYRRWYTTAATGSGITAGFDPTSVTSRFPFLNAAGTNQRSVHINRSLSTTTGNTAGYLAVVYSDATSMTTGLSVVDGAYTVTDRYDGNWTVTAEAGYIYASGTHGIAISANGAYPPLNGNTRVMLANTAMAGTHQNGTVTPTGQRVGLTTGQLTAGTLYLGIASADNQYPCAGTPNIPEALATTATSICPNGTVTMNATGLTTGFIGITNQWQVSSVSGGPYTNVVGGTGATTATHTTAAIATPGTYYYVLASTCTNSTTTSISNEVVVTVNPLPTVTATPANAGAFCGVGSLTASGAVNYTWSPSTSLLSSTGSSVTSIATANTTFTVTGTDANGCVNTATASIVYTAPPSITISASTSTFCGTGGNSTLTAASTGNYSYVWEPLDGATLSTTIGNITDAAIIQTSSFRVTGTETATGCVEIQNISIGVYPLPAANVTTSASGVCPGTPATINSGLSAGNFSATCITPKSTLSTPPSNATILCNNGTATTTLSGGGLDDGYWNNRPIGFGFNYFGVNQTQVMIGTNGTIIIGGGTSTAYSFTGGFPNLANPANCIAAVARDLQLSSTGGNFSFGAGIVRHWTEGVAPNRRFIVQYENCATWYSTNGTDGRNTVEVVLYETLGTVEIYVIEASNPAATTGSFINDTRNKFIGLQDGTRTIGATAPNCSSPFQANFWNGISNDITSPLAWRFAPPSNYATTWTATNSGGTTTLASGNNIFSQSVSPSETTTYSISYTNQTTGCTNAAGSAQVTMQVLGTVAPNNVTAQASAGNACSGVSFNLSTNYTGLTDGLTYQWQVSTDNGVSWTDITGATALTYSTSITVPSLFRIGIISCGGTIEYSAPASVGLSPPTDCYCTPIYTTGTSFGDLISNVTIVGTTLSNNTGFATTGPSYTFYTGQPNYTATLLPSSSYTLQISTGEYGDQGYAAWIDYNDDGVFSSSELVGATPTVIGSGLTTGVINASSSFTIALACTPPAGVHRMRIRGVYNENGPTIDPCATYTWGETEDYLITIAPAPTCPAPGLMTAGTTTSTTAPLSWNMGCSVATNFDFEYGPAGFTQGTGTLLSNQLVTVNGTTGLDTLTGLTPNTAYSVYFRANCGNGDVSPWSVATNFTTQCAPISLNDPGNAVACDTYSLPVLTESVASNNASLTLGYFNAPNGTGGQITGPITSTQQVYAHGAAGSCLTDSVFTVTIYNTPILTVINPTICLGDSTELWATQGNAIDFVYTLNNNFIGSGVAYHVTPTATTTYGISAVGLGGCISAEQQATVTVNQPTTSTTTATSCDSYAWNGQTYTQSGTYTFTTNNALGCDSVATLNLTINNSTTSSTSITACDSYAWNGQTYTQSGSYTFQTTNAVGCDSTATLNLTINNSTTSTSNVTACVSYLWNGQTYTQSGTYTYQTTNAVGCDSTATLNLTINNALFTTENVSACISYAWNGQTYTQSGTYTYLTTSVNGCDSTVTLNLTINQPSASTTTQTACNTYSWNGQTYTQSGTYVFNTTTVAGCDSTATLVLTINSSTSSSSTQTACDSYTWNGQTYTQSGTYTYTTTNSVGCDSVATLVLTLNASSSSNSAQTACGSYTWNGQTYTQSGTYTYTTPNAVGCDSTATLVLTINAIPTATATDNGDGTATASSGSSYQWIDCATNTAITGATQQTFAPDVTGQYSVVVTNASGCSDTSSCITVNAANMDELSNLSIQVNPNPSTGLFNLTVNSTANGVITITDATGRIVGTQIITGASSVIDLTNSVTGIYYFNVQIGESEKVVRVIKN
jgi:hypothetical protein